MIQILSSSLSCQFAKMCSLTVHRMRCKQCSKLDPEYRVSYPQACVDRGTAKCLGVNVSEKILVSIDCCSEACTQAFEALREKTEIQIVEKLEKTHL